MRCDQDGLSQTSTGAFAEAMPSQRRALWEQAPKEVNYLGVIADLSAAASGGAGLIPSALAQPHQGHPIGSLRNFKGRTEQVIDIRLKPFLNMLND